MAWHSPLIGIVGLILYYSVTTVAWGNIVARILPLYRAWSRIFGFLVSFYLSAFAIGIPVVVWKYDRLSVAIAMLVVGLIGLVLSLRAKRSGAKQSYNRDEQDPTKDRLNRDDKIASAFGLAMTFSKWHLVLLGLLSVFFIYYLAQARTGAYIFSPWDILPSFVLMLFFVITFLIGLLVFSNRSIKVVLGVLILFSFLAHLYLPVVYETGFGGDKWRHLGAERWLQQDNIYTPSVWGEAKRSMVNIGPLALPEALVVGNKTSYAPQWASTIMLAESLGVDVFWVDLLLVFLLWSFFLPLILYQFGRLIFGSNRLGLFFAFLSALFYTFQSEGAITIPVSFGHLFFFFVLLLWAAYVKTGQRATFWAAWLLSLAFYWCYILNFFVLIGVGILATAYRRLFLDRNHWQNAILFGCLVAVSALAIPFLEVFQGLSRYVPGAISGRGILDALANAFGQISGWIGTVAPPDFIDQGNFLYNQTMESLSRLPLFSYRLVPFVISLSAWIIIVWGIQKLFKNPEPSRRNSIVFLGVIFLIALTSYFISWSFTEGVHVLARRLNETIVFFMVLFLGWGFWLWLQTSAPSFTKEGVRGWSKIAPRKKIWALCFALAFAATSTFASGPKLQLVTTDELKAAELVWSELKDERPPYCVIANTWPLLGLEAVSGRRITGGNFPLYNEYAQPERVKIFEMLSKKPALLWFEGAFRITGADTCYYMNEKQWLSDFVFNDTVKLLGEPRKVGTVYIWRVENRRTVIAKKF